jgi:hypothetical protein
MGTVCHGHDLGASLYMQTEGKLMY